MVDSWAKNRGGPFWNRITPILNRDLKPTSHQGLFARSVCRFHPKMKFRRMLIHVYTFKIIPFPVAMTTNNTQLCTVLYIISINSNDPWLFLAVEIQSSWKTLSLRRAIDPTLGRCWEESFFSDHVFGEFNAKLQKLKIFTDHSIHNFWILKSLTNFYLFSAFSCHLPSPIPSSTRAEVGKVGCNLDGKNIGNWWKPFQ